MGSDHLQQRSQRHSRRGLVCVPFLFAFASLACSGDAGVILAPTVPLAYTRFVHAVPDTGGTDWRFIDDIENSPVAFGLTFRSSTPYQATGTGSRRLRVFPSSTNIDVTSRFLIDTTLVLEADTYYTIVHLGYATAGQSPRHQLVVLRADFPRTMTPTVAVRAVHLGSGFGDVQVYADTGGGSPLPVDPLVPTLSLGSASAYNPVEPGRLELHVTAVGGNGDVVASGVAPAGESESPGSNLTAIGGSRMAGSALSALFFPRSAQASSAPQTAAFTVPALVFLIDRHPR